MIVAILSGAIVSMFAGMMLASYAVAGVTPSHLPQPAVRTVSASLTDRDRIDDLTTVQQIAARVSDARPTGYE